MKNKRGISLITLIVMIVIMIILATITMRVATDSYEKSIETKAEAEKEQLRKAITGRFAANQRNNTANPIVGILIPEEKLKTKEEAIEFICSKLQNEYGKYVNNLALGSDETTQKELIEEFVSDNFDDMEYTRILTSSDLIDLDLENTNLNAVYLVNYYSADVVGPIN